MSTDDNPLPRRSREELVILHDFHAASEEEACQRMLKEQAQARLVALRNPPKDYTIHRLLNRLAFLESKVLPRCLSDRETEETFKTISLVEGTLEEKFAGELETYRKSFPKVHVVKP